MLRIVIPHWMSGGNVIEETKAVNEPERSCSGENKYVENSNDDVGDNWDTLNEAGHGSSASSDGRDT